MQSVMKLMEHDNGEEQYLASEDTISVPIRGGLQNRRGNHAPSAGKSVRRQDEGCKLLGISRSTLWDGFIKDVSKLDCLFKPSETAKYEF